MAMFVPHASKEGIQTGNAGQAANYRGAGEFMTPGDRAMPDALQNLSQSLQHLGNTVHVINVQDQQAQQELAVLEDLQTFYNQESQWRAAYPEQYAGKDAETAAIDYTAFVDKASQPILNRFKGNPRAQAHVQARIMTTARNGAESLGAYARQQAKVYEGSLVDRQYTQLVNLYKNPDSSPGEIEAAQRDYAGLRQRQLLKQGFAPEAVAVTIGEDFKTLSRGRLENRLAVLRDSDPAAGAAMVDRALYGTSPAPGLPADIVKIITVEALSQGVDPALALAVAAQESGGRADAVSPAGARGVMQLMPGTAKELGVDPDDPAQNVKGGVAYLKKMLDRYGGDETLALAGYNWGPTNADAWRKTGKGKDGQLLPGETQNYIPAVLSRAGEYGVSTFEAEELRSVLTPKELVAHRAAMERATVAQARAQEVALKAQRAEAEKGVYAKAFDGTLTRADVEAARDLLSPEDYFKSLKLLDGEGSLPGKSDPEALILLQRQAVTGDPDIQQTADDFLRAGRLTGADYSKMLNEAQQWRKPAIRQADEVLRLKTGYSDMNPTPDAGNSYLMARNDFQEWLDSEEGKKAGDDEKLRMANRVGDNYRLAQAESILSVPVPLFLVGSRTAPDITKTIAATERAHAEGRLSDSEYAEQARRIKRMADILESQARETGNSRENRR